jgi:hypothetical protein
MIAHPSSLRRLILCALLVSCSSGTIGPTAGVLTVKLNPIQGDEGAVMFTVTGGPVDSIESTAAVVHTAALDANTIRVIVAGELSPGTIARIRIGDMSQAANYSATVNQVAARQTYAPRDPTSYSLTLVP